MIKRSQKAVARAHSEEKGDFAEQIPICKGIEKVMIRIALTKGRIEKQAAELLSRCGYDMSELAEKGRKLIFHVPEEDIEIVLAKAADVITYVEHGVCDVGMVGADTIMEHAKSVCELLDLNFGRCKFALAGLQGRNFYDGYGHKVIASKYPHVTKTYFTEKGMDVEVVKIEGSVELAPLLSLSDAIVDIVETGATLRENGLEVYEEIAYISTRLIVNPASLKLKKREIDQLIGRISEVLSRV